MEKIIKKFYKINKCNIIQLDSNDKMNIGYGSLNYKIVSHNKSYLLKKYSDGLIVSTACLGGL